MTSNNFTGFYGVTALVTVSGDKVFVVAEDTAALERVVNIVLAGEGEFVPERAKPCVLINPETLTPQ